MKKKVIGLVALCLPILPGCDDSCDDCLELVEKEVRYVDGQGSDLIFNENAPYEPDDLVIEDASGQPQPVLVDEASRSLGFNLDPGIQVYRLVLADTLVDTLSFNLSTRPSRVCCGNVTFSTRTLLNSVEIENEDLIIIVR